MSIIGDKRTAYFIRLMNGTPFVISKKNVKPAQDKITYSESRTRKATFILDTSKPAFRIGRTFVYMVDVKVGQIHFGSTVSKVSPELIDAILNQSLAKQLVSGLHKMNVWNILGYILLAMGMGIPVGYILGNFMPIG